MEQEIIEIMSELINAGFTIELKKRGFTIIESYKSIARDKWEDKEIFSVSNSSEYFPDDFLEDLKEFKKTEINHSV